MKSALEDEVLEEPVEPVAWIAGIKKDLFYLMAGFREQTEQRHLYASSTFLVVTPNKSMTPDTSFGHFISGVYR